MSKGRTAADTCDRTRQFKSACLETREAVNNAEVRLLAVKDLRRNNPAVIPRAGC
ncbi:MAG: hypothetical protein WCG29_04470 [Desulfomonile sp.]|nr:hypothetical protein [Deltaproteobacteria bacterium]